MRPVILALTALLSTAPLAAQVTPPPATAAAPAGPVVRLETRQDISSKKLRVGDTFPLVVAEDVALPGGGTIPRGTPATGAVSWRTGKGTMGKSAKMEIEFRSIEWQGAHLPLTGKDRQEGKGNGPATVGTLLLFGPLAAGITGTSAIFRKGRVFTAHLAQPAPSPAT